jgi:hypothetical protein
VIWQAITCDICGAEKHQTNHWFIAYKELGELHISAWDSPRLLCQGTKHLCGERCLHKMMDKFLSELVNKSTQFTTEDRPIAAESAPTEQPAHGGPASPVRQLPSASNALSFPEWEHPEAEAVPLSRSAVARRNS